MQHKLLARKIIRALKKQGAVIHRYDASSSNSIYLKIDSGICGSIRISDHMGKRKMNYRYNLLTNIETTSSMKDPFERFFYPAEQVDLMIAEIIRYRELKMAEYHGAWFYKAAVQGKAFKHRKQPGFWEKASIV